MRATLTALIRETEARLQVEIFTRELVTTAGLICLSLAVFSLLFWQDAQGAVRVWIESRTFNHCFLILPLSLFLVWDRRDALKGLNPEPQLRAGIAMVGPAAVWLVTSAAGILELQQFAVISMVQVALWGLMGSVLYLRLLAPLLYLYFLVPSGTILVPELQSFTARFAVAGLHLFHIPVFSNGAVIEIPVGNFAVAEACAGLRFLIAAVAFGVFYAVLTYRSLLRRLLFIGLSIIVPIVANGIRALGLLVSAEWLGSPAAALADHIIYGWLFFSFVLFLLILIGRYFSDRDGEKAVAHSSALLPSKVDGRRMALVVSVCFAAAAWSPLVAAYLGAARPHKLPTAGPEVNPSWHRATTAADWTPVVEGPTRTFADSFDDGGTRIDRYVALYGGDEHDRNAIHSDNRAADERRWSFNARATATLFVHGRQIPVQVTTWVQGSRKRAVWAFFVVNGVATSDLWAAKLEQLYARLSASPCISGYVALSVEEIVEKPSSGPIERLLDASQPFQAYFCAAERQ